MVIIFRTRLKHITAIPVDIIFQAIRLSTIGNILCLWTMAATKASIVLLLLLRLECGVWWRPTMYALLALLLITAVIGTVSHAVMCSLSATNWYSVGLQNTSHCLASSTLIDDILAVSAMFLRRREGVLIPISLHIATDFICALLPIVIIRQLNRPLRERVVMGILMAMGLFASACGIMKAILFARVDVKSLDAIWNLSPSLA
ncbi:hypothetical protein EJ06DRAFT_255265 [Trichodelitschia bisporula]|uniref:Rhodopsin domain-containing protein n=1 Tax=Trichodelitschia bisporula TaxID=703511 RepID=A0A6G1HIZ8_9PEZI|nr:hypothetical protein EJ06DRAFT_255265 [Trichodelitschia bisporula]